MNGEKIQWLVLEGDRFAITEPMTTDEIKAQEGAKWYRPMVSYEQQHMVAKGVANFTTEIHDTSHWLENFERIEEMRERNGDVEDMVS